MSAKNTKEHFLLCLWGFCYFFRADTYNDIVVYMGVEEVGLRGVSFYYTVRYYNGIWNNAGLKMLTTHELE